MSSSTAEESTTAEGTYPIRNIIVLIQLLDACMMSCLYVF